MRAFPSLSVILIAEETCWFSRPYTGSTNAYTIARNHYAIWLAETCFSRVMGRLSATLIGKLSLAIHSFSPMKYVDLERIKLNQLRKGRKTMKASLIVGIAAGTAIGTIATMAMHGDFSSRRMRRMGKKLAKKAHQMGIDL